MITRDSVSFRSVSAREVLERGTERLRDELAGQPEFRARLLTAVGGVYVDLSLFKEAEPLVREGLEIREKVFGPDSLEVAESLQLLGKLTAFARGPQEMGAISRLSSSSETRCGRPRLGACWADHGVRCAGPA